jgi:CHASE2 domain-containing sensor protein/signal transduction histidine kinase
MKTWVSLQPLLWRSRPLRDWLFTLGIALGLLYSMHALSLGQTSSWRLHDLMLRWTDFQSRSDIVVIAIDDRSLKELQAWPLRRQHYADFLSRLQQDGIHPKAIGIDLIFHQGTPDDEVLAQAMQGLPVVLPLSASQDRHDHEMAPRDSAPRSNDFWDYPPEPIRKQASAFGHMQIQFDDDGVIRTIENEVAGVDHLALSMIKTGASPQDKALQAYLAPQGWRKNFRMVDVNVGFTTLSLVDALNPVLSLDMLQDKWVLIGVTAAQTGDTYYTGNNDISTPGVYIVASTLNDVLNLNAIRVLPTSIVVSIGSALLLALSLLFIRTHPTRVFTYSLALTGSLLCVAYVLLNHLNIWLNIVPLCFAIHLMAGIWSWRRLVSTVRQIRTEIRTSFRHEATSPKPPTAPADWLQKKFQDMPQRVVEQLHSAIDSEQHTFKLLQASLQQVPTPIAIFDQQDQHWVSNQAMHAITHQISLLQSAPRYTFVQLQERLLRHATEPQRNTLDRALISMDPLSQLATFYQATVSTIRISQDLQLRMVTLLDITWSQRHHNQREETLQFLSHDMRTPLACMQASIDHLNQAEPVSADTVAQTLDQIRQQTERLRQMMDGFIVHSQAHQAQLQLTECLVHDLLDDAVAQSFELVRQYRIQIKVQDGEIPLRVRVDVQMMLRTLINLIHNAIRHCETGQSVIVRSQIGQREQAPMVRIEIENPVSNPTLHANTEHRGFGLGLRFVQTVLSRHQGRLNISIPPALAGPRVAVVTIELPLIR